MLTLPVGCERPERPPEPPPVPRTDELPKGVERGVFRAEGLAQDRRHLLYVPESLDGARRGALVLVLPGIGADPVRTIQVLPHLRDEAERHEFVLLLADSTGYIGSSRFVRDNRLNELHADYLFGLVDHVAGRMSAERGLSIDRRFVVGTSAGGAGAWYLVLQRPVFWSGIGLVVGASLSLEGQLDRLAHLRVAYLLGERDGAVSNDRNRDNAAALERAGAAVQLMEVAGAGHRVARTTGLPELFAFLFREPLVN